jgi:hypothetical protein
MRPTRTLLGIARTVSMSDFLARSILGVSPTGFFIEPDASKINRTFVSARATEGPRNVATAQQAKTARIKHRK